MRVLVIEDDHQTALAITTALKGMECIVVHSVEEAVAMLKKEEVHIIVTDDTLPIHTAIDFIEWLRQPPGIISRTPVLVLAHDASVEAKVKTLNAGASDYMTKPFHKDELVARIEAVTRTQIFGEFDARERSAKILKLLPKTGDVVDEPLARV